MGALLLLVPVSMFAASPSAGHGLRVKVFDARCATGMADCNSPLFEKTREALAGAGVIVTGSVPAENPRREHELWYTAGNREAAEKLWKDHLADFLGNRHEGGEWKWGGDFDAVVVVGNVAIPHRGTWPPSLSDYETRAKPRAGKIAINYAPTPDAKRFHTRLTEAMAEGPNFAGYCKVVTWGCGSGCQTGYVIDLNRGFLFEIPSASVGLEYEKGSRLLVVNPPANVQAAFGDSPPDYVVTKYLVFEKDGLVPLEEAVDR